MAPGVIILIKHDEKYHELFALIWNISFLKIPARIFANWLGSKREGEIFEAHCRLLSHQADDVFSVLVRIIRGNWLAPPPPPICSQYNQARFNFSCAREL